MGSGSYLLATIGAAAFRFLLGVDGGIDYDTTAISPDICPDVCPGAEGCNEYCNSEDRRGEPIPRVPWALRIRPDVLLAIFNSRQYFYVQGDGSFVQPLLDTYEGGGGLIVGARLRVGPDVGLQPTAFVRARSSNELLRSQTVTGGGVATTQLFYSVSGGGGLEVEVPIAGRLRLVGRAQVEAWVLDLIPQELRDFQPAVQVTASLGALIALTHIDGLAVEAQGVDQVFLPESEDTVQHQGVLGGRVVYRRFWLPSLMTDIGIGLVGQAERDGSWAPNVTASAMLISVGRPRWLTASVGYERRFEYITVLSPGAMQDVAEAMAAFGPFNGFELQLSLTWTRTEMEVRSRVSGARTDRPFHTIGAAVQARYLYEVSNFGFGPFFEGYVFSPFAEERPYDLTYEYLPPGYDVVEEVLLLGVRVQWGTANARSRRGGQEGGALGAGSSRDERRLAMQRMTREERSVPTFAWGVQSMTTTDAEEEALFDEFDPFGRQGGEYEPEAPEQEPEERSYSDEDAEDTEDTAEGAPDDWGGGDEEGGSGADGPPAGDEGGPPPDDGGWGGPPGDAPAPPSE